MEYIRFQDSAEIARIDAPFVSTETKSYVEANKYQYYVAINVWCNLTSEIDPKASDVLLDNIRAKGLISVIRICDSGALSLIRGEECDDFTLFLCRNMTFSQALQVLRFLKRFSPLKADCVEKNGLANFVSLLNEVKMKSRREPNQWLIAQLRAVVHDICKGFSAEDLAVDGYFSSGAVQNTAKCIGAKMQAWNAPCFLDVMYPLSSRDTKVEPEFSESPRIRVAKAVAVPKSYKVPRIIAEEESTRQWHLQAIRYRLEACIKANGYKEHIALENQCVNQCRAFLGSVEQDTFCTIDLSSASDRLQYSLFAACFPATVVDAVREWRSSYVSVNGKTYPAYMVATSGSAICFVVESIMFYAIARVASDMNGEGDMAYAYGDDIIVGAKSYATCCEMLEALGFVVNLDKSFCPPSHYRESCGVEFIDGVETTAVYWPRKPITPSIEHVQSLVKLHNRLYDYWGVHTFLKEAIRRLVGKKFTTSTTTRFVTDYPSDVWDPIQNIIPLKESYDGGDDHLCDGHMAVHTKPDKSRRPYSVPEMYYYVMYLLHGPLFEDPLLELLGVSSPRRKVEDQYSTVEYFLTIERDI